MIQVEKRFDANETVIKINGSIEENVDFGNIFGPLNSNVVINCKGLTRLNSIGVKYWIQYFKKLSQEGVKFKFTECSPAFIDQLSIVHQIACGGQVESLYVPFSCEQCSGEFVALFQVTKLKELQFKVPRTKCPKCGGEAVLDDDPEEYFAFFKD